MTIPVRDLASFDSADSQWIVEPGTYAFLVGDNVENIAEVAGLTLGKYTEKVNNALPLKASLNILHK